LNQITKMRLPGGAEVALVDWTHRQLYSTVDLLTGFTQQEIDLFTYVSGDPVPAFGPTAQTRRTATDRDTNVSTAGAMASTEEMLVYAIKPEVHLLEQTNEADDMTTLGIRSPGQPNPSLVALAVLNHDLILRLVISQKVYAEAGFGYFNAGFGPFGNGIAQTQLATGIGYGNPGEPSHAAAQTFAIPHHIGGQEKYRVSLVNPTGAAVNLGYDDREAPAIADDVVAQIRVYLDGLYKRPVS